MDNFVVDKDNLKVDFHYCALVSAWKKLGVDDAKIAKFCDIAMDGDRGIAESMGPHARAHGHHRQGLR